ncbi:MAG TPA: hypothetical protein VH478_13490 [Trebonia sp.]|nr:hypothetical protein [Trebonia sp.]
MAGIRAERAAFDDLGERLRATAAASARALRAHRGTPAGETADQHLEHVLDRLATLYGQGTYENLRTPDIVEAAVGNELRLAATLPGPDAAAAAGRARALVDAARRGTRLHVREPGPPARVARGVHVAPLRPEVERSLWAAEEPYLRWGDGGVLIAGDDEVAALRAAGDEVSVLFLDADELLDLDLRDDRPALEAELARRQAVARAAPDGVGDSPARHVLRLLHGQSVVLRNLRDRLAGDHPAARAALVPVLAGHRALHERVLAPAAPGPGEDPLGEAIEAERAVQEHLGRWSAEPGDEAGLRPKFRLIAGAGNHLPALERHHR